MAIVWKNPTAAEAIAKRSRRIRRIDSHISTFLNATQMKRLCDRLGVDFLALFGSVIATRANAVGPAPEIWVVERLASDDSWQPCPGFVRKSKWDAQRQRTEFVRVMGKPARIRKYIAVD